MAGQQQAIVKLYDPVDKTELIWPTAPRDITTSAGTEVASVSLDNFGTLSRPRGRPPTSYRWTATFYGAGRLGSPYILPFWRPPEDIKYLLERWHDTQPRRPVNQPLELTVEATNFPTIYKPVFIEALGFTWRGAFGDLDADISLIEWRSAVVGLDAVAAETGEEVPVSEETAGEAVDEPPIPNAVTVQSGDSLWALAQLHLGDGARWPEIYEMNAETIGSNPDLILPGQELLMPGGTEGPPEPAIPERALAFEEFTQSMPNFGNPQLPGQ